MLDLLKGLGSALGAARDIVQGFFPPTLSDAEKAAATLKLEQFLSRSSPSAEARTARNLRDDLGFLLFSIVNMYPCNMLLCA